MPSNPFGYSVVQNMIPHVFCFRQGGLAHSFYLDEAFGLSYQENY